MCLAAQQNATELVKPERRFGNHPSVDSADIPAGVSQKSLSFYRFATPKEQRSTGASTKHSAVEVRARPTQTEAIPDSPSRPSMGLLNLLPTDELPMTMMPSPLRQAWLDLFSFITDSEVPLFTFHFIVGIDIQNGVSKTDAQQEAIEWLESDCLNGLFSGRWYLSPDLSVRQLNESELSGLSSGAFPKQRLPKQP